jgi:release factor glutamine methyltransferase|tara:strand:- start:4095 stop:4943 length:849 start_codon:yes stop_codon:yes gene_type:complete
MQLKSLHNFFKNGLIGYYPKEEIDAFFYRICAKQLKLKRIDITLQSEMIVAAQTFEYFEMVIERLLNYEPIQYILGSTFFFGSDFIVDKQVLIPRPETEELISWVLEKADTKQPIKILDVGTGSGCIAISLAKQLPLAQVYAMDVSLGALSIAKQNAKANGVVVHFIEASVLEWENQDLFFDVIVSNPPYVRESEKEMMSPNVLNHEPHLALFVENNNPLLFYKAIVELSKKNLAKEGLIYFEINEYLAKETTSLFASTFFEEVQLKADIFSKNRMLRAKKC